MAGRAEVRPPSHRGPAPPASGPIMIDICFTRPRCGRPVLQPTSRWYGARKEAGWAMGGSI